MSFILKTDTLFKKQTEDPLKLVQAVCHSNDFRTNSFFPALDKKTFRLGDDEKEHLLETTESAPFRTTAVSGSTIPVLMNVLLAEKNEHIQKLENQLQELTETHNSLLQQLEISKEQQAMLLEESKEEQSVHLEISEGEITQPVLTEREVEDVSVLEQANTLPQDSRETERAPLELSEGESMHSFLIEKDAEIISLKHEMAALQEELLEKEILLKESLKKLENMHESMVQNQEQANQLQNSQEHGLLNSEQDKLESCIKMEKSKDLLSPPGTEIDETKDITICEFSKNQVAEPQERGKCASVKDGQKEKDTVLEHLLESLRDKICRMEEQCSVGTSKSDTFIAAAGEQPEEKLEEKNILEDAPNIQILKERKLLKEKMYLEKLCSLLIQERLQGKHIIELESSKIPKRNGTIGEDNLEMLLQRDDDETASGESIVKRDETSLEGFLISLILKDLERSLDSKERKGGNNTEEEGCFELKVKHHMGQVESNGSATLPTLKEKQEECKVLIAEEITPENSLTLMQGMQQTKSIIKQKQDIIEMPEVNVNMEDKQTLRDDTNALPEKDQVVDNPLVTLQQELETCKKERDVLLQKLEDYELRPPSSLQTAAPSSLMQIQESSPTLLHELQTLRQERDALEIHLRSQVLKESNLLLDYNMLKNEYENLQITLEKTAIERDDLEIKLNEYTWKEKQLDRLRYQAKQSEILRIERDRMKIKLEELAGIEVAYIKLMEKTEKLEKMIIEGDNHKERSQDKVKSVKSETCEKASQVSDTVLMEDTCKRATQLPNSMVMKGTDGRIITETCERASHSSSFVLMEDIAEAMNTGLCKTEEHLMKEKATQTLVSDLETSKRRVRRKQDITRLQEQVKVVQEYVDKIAVLRDERHQVQTELNKLREEINKHTCAVNNVQELKQKLKKAQKLKENVSDKVLEDIKLQLRELTQENLFLKDEAEKLRNAKSQLKSQLKKREKFAKQVRTFEDDRKCLQKEFNQLQQVIAKESFRSNQMLKLADNIDHLQLSDMCEEVQNFRFIFQQLLTETTAMKETEMQLKNLTTQMDEEILALGEKVAELQEENTSLRDALFERQESLRRQIHGCDKELLVIKRNISEFSKRVISVKSYKNQLFQLNQENVSLKYKILALKEGMSLKQASSLSEEVKNLKFELNLLHKENATLSERILELSQENLNSSMPSNEINFLKHEMEKTLKENEQLQQRVSILEKENNILKQNYLSPDETPSFITQINEESIVHDKLEKQKKEMASKEDSAATDNMQALKHQVNQLIQENQGLREKLKNIQTQDNLAQNLVKENNSLKCNTIGKAESSALLTIFVNRNILQPSNEVENVETERTSSSYEITCLKNHITQLQEALEGEEGKCKYLEDKLAEIPNKRSSEEVALLKNQILQLEKALEKQNEKCIYLENELAETTKYSSEEITLKNQVAQLQKELEGQVENFKYLKDKVSYEVSQKVSPEEAFLLRNHNAELQKALEEQEEKCIHLEKEIAEMSNKQSSKEIVFLKNQIAQLQEELIGQEEKSNYLENELAKTSNKYSSEEVTLLRSHIIQLQKELEGQDEKRKYLENELAETSNKLIECEVKIKLQTEAITGSTDTSNHVLEDIKKQLLEEQGARELSEEVLHYTQYELDKERILTKELQSQVSTLEVQLAEERQHLKQLSESRDNDPLSKYSKETSQITVKELPAEMENLKTKNYKLEKDKAKLEETIKCNKVSISENVDLKQCLQDSKHIDPSIENKMKELEILKAENLQLLNKIKSYENQISIYDEELHKLSSEIECLKEQAKLKTSAEKILEMGLEIKQKFETLNKNSEAIVEDKNLSTNFEELKVQVFEIGDIVSKKNQECLKVQQQEQKKQGEELMQLSTIIHSFHVAIQELNAKLSETAAEAQVSELKDLEHATGKLEAEVKVLKEQLLCGDTATMILLDTCISEKQQLLGYFQNLMDELKTIKKYGNGLDILKNKFQQKIEENVQLETIVKKLKSENDSLRQSNFKEEDKAPCTLQEVKYVVDCIRRKCQTCAEEYDRCINLLKESSLQELLNTENHEEEWRNKCTNLEQELQEVKKLLSKCEKKLQKATLEKESQKLKSLSLEKELKHFQHKFERQNISEGEPTATESVKHTIRLKDSTQCKTKSLHSLKQTSSNGDYKDTDKIQEVIQLIERMRRKCRRCATAYEHCTNLLTQAITKSVSSSNDVELMTLQQNYEKLLNEFETKKSVEEELIAERAKVLCLQKEIENMKNNIEEYKLQERITFDNILDSDRKKIVQLEQELCEWKKKYEDSWNLISSRTLSDTKTKSSSSRIKKMKAEITQLKKQVKELRKEEVSSEMLSAERAKNINLQKELENLRKEFEQYKIQEQYYIEDMLNTEVQKTVALEKEVTEWKHKYEACWKLMNMQSSCVTESVATTAHVQAMESEIADLKEKLSIYKMERSMLEPQMSVSKMADSQIENMEVLEKELRKLRSRNKELNETMEEMETKHQHEVKDLKDKIGELEMKLASMSGEQNSDYEETITNLRLEFQKQLTEKETMYEANIKSVKSSFERDIKNLKKLHDESILRLQKQHDEEMQDINRMHEAELKAISVPTGDDILQHHNVSLTSEISQNTLQATDYATEYSDVNSTEVVSRGSLMTHSSPSRSFTNILTKVIQNGINALNFTELSHLHQEVCQATSAFILDAKDVTGAEMWKSSKDSLGQAQLSKCISALQMEVLKRQKEAEKKVLYFGMQICKERKRMCELREHLRHEKEENLDLRNCIGAQTQSIATLKMEKALLQRQSECIKQQLQQYIVLLKKERARARLLEEEVSKVKSTKKKLETLLEMEKKYNETNETRQAHFIESMKMKLDTAIESEAKLRYQLNQKQSCQMVMREWLKEELMH